MKSIKTRKIICMIMLMVKDAIKLLAQCLVSTILIGICIENGWILSNYTSDISYDMFWKLYSVIFLLVPIIMFWRGLTGRYKVEIKVYKDEFALGYAKQVSEE